MSDKHHRTQVRAAKRQAAKRGCANPLGWARWDMEGEDLALRTKGKRQARPVLEWEWDDGSDCKSNTPG